MPDRIRGVARRMHVYPALRAVKWWGVRIRARWTGTYSQAGEDKILAGLLREAGVLHGTYIDVGANHPWVMSNSYLLYRNGWAGVVVEPLSTMVHRLEKHRPRDVCVHGLCGSVVGTSVFFHMDPHVLSTASIEEKELLIASDTARLVTSEEMPVTTVGELTRQYLGGRLDVLFTDTEGNDLEVLDGVDWLRSAPRVIVCEISSPTRSTEGEVTDYLAGKGYVSVASTDFNALFVRSDWPRENQKPSKGSS